MHVICEWGLSGVEALIDRADVFVIVDVLSFSTCVDVACARGARVFPFPIFDRQAAEKEAYRLDAELAGKRSDLRAKYTLSAPQNPKTPKPHLCFLWMVQSAYRYKINNKRFFHLDQSLTVIGFAGLLSF